ncbi:helix-hairpin-helix domain-containing protein [Chitinophaga sp. XS-30]|uniref:helix-hairpin-helix domain-containing protein n=1 Tax=Chitinophaga sp. XS-30 TaxID=2604421 RepID=UPI0011DDCE3E|nr:helix-hairpin-helix domain-containing protein [Chitinophaga sp. XS-30]QEH41190.1 DNA polymerase/3'-5' exonuclease PolX [Chitinophaga sp. XS-30]
MDNYIIADNLSLLAKLMDIHGDNSFKAKSFANAAFQIEKLTVPLQETPHDAIFRIKGIGESTGKSVIEMLQTGRFGLLEEYLQKTPPGILEMMRIKGIGPKKIATIWKELEIETLGELLYACNENRLLLFKGFGQKTQESIKQSIEFFLSNRERFLYAEVEAVAAQLEAMFSQIFAPAPVALTGAFRRQQPVIDELEIVIGVPAEKVAEQLKDLEGFTRLDNTADVIILKYQEQIKVMVYGVDQPQFARKLFVTTGNDAFLEQFRAHAASALDTEADSEEAIFTKAGLPFIPPCMREGAGEIALAAADTLPELIQTGDIKGIIHSHSQWSDGLQSLEDMAKAARDQGFEYLVISDHSRSAFYANGLQPERIIAQHQQIDQLNSQLAPFRIFKSIEADILNDGSLDYPDDILRSFDLVIASVHSNLKMPEDKAMARLLKAIANPYTTILGHMTGRLLLSRNGYPVDHEAIIDACVAHDVVIELNAHPRRLDIDWQWIPSAIRKGALLSIDPDAHAVAGYHDIRYGTLAAQKGGLSREKNLSSFTKAELEAFLLQRKQRKGI